MVNCKHIFLDTGKFDDLYSYVKCAKCGYEKADYREEWEEENDDDDYYDE